jgi:FHS family L-fucose permease-like MFS transporter
MTESPSPESHDSQRPPVVPLNIVWPFILLTSLFAWWGLANNMTDTLLAAFKRIMSMTDASTALIQVVFYGAGYGLLALPAAIFIKKFNYKLGVLLGLGLYVAGALLFYPAKVSYFYYPDLTFFFFLAALWILSGGLSILETAANPYICAMGPEETATRRLNFAQSFNPLGSIFGVILSQLFILSQLSKAGAEERAAMSDVDREAMQAGELNAVTMTYVVVGLILLLTWAMIAFTKMPKARDTDTKLDLIGTFGRLTRNPHYVWGVIAQFFYVGAQIGVWSFTIRYVMQELKLEELALPAGVTAESLAAGYYTSALVLFMVSRFVCTWLMKFMTPGNLLALLSFVAIICTLLVIFPVGGKVEIPVPFVQAPIYLTISVAALIAISGCMSLMFPTIFGLAVRGLGEDTKLGGAGVIMAILGGAVLTQAQGYVSDWTQSINQAYWVPLIAFVVIAYYGAVACRMDLPATASD